VTDAPSTTPGSRPAVQPSWGLGDVALGILLSQFLSLAISIAVFSAAGWTTSSDVPLWASALLQIPLWGGWLAAVFLAGRTKGNGVVADFGLRLRPVDAPVGLGLGTLMQLLVLPVMYAPLLWLLGQTSDDLSAPARALSSKAEGAVGWIVLVLIVVVGAPVVEELFYRGLFLRALRKRGMADWWAAVVSAAVFAAMHLQPLQFLGLFALGLLLAYLANRTGRLGPSICTHAAFNATSVVLLYLR
jgi:membrane protease YdiL (CAAX protease family)